MQVNHYTHVKTKGGLSSVSHTHNYLDKCIKLIFLYMHAHNILLNFFFTCKLVFVESKCYFLVDLIFLLIKLPWIISAKVPGSTPGHGSVFLPGIESLLSQNIKSLVSGNFQS